MWKSILRTQLNWTFWNKDKVYVNIRGYVFCFLLDVPPISQHSVKGTEKSYTPLFVKAIISSDLYKLTSTFNTLASLGWKIQNFHEITKYTNIYRISYPLKSLTNQICVTWHWNGNWAQSCNCTKIPCRCPAKIVQLSLWKL